MAQSQVSRAAKRPFVSVILAMSADGKIADSDRTAARFPSSADKAHLEAQVAKADATLFGAGTLRAYRTSLPVSNPQLLAERRSRQQPEQPIHIVCSATGQLDRQWRFFQQPLPRWLLTTPAGAAAWGAKASPPANMRSGALPAFDQQVPFERIIVTEAPPLTWTTILPRLNTDLESQPISRLLVMGGGELVASLLAEGLVDELFLTVCPLLIGGQGAPTPVGGPGFSLPNVPQLKLQSSQVVGDEVFLHYRLHRLP